jgi:hypothetical protein
VWNQILNPLLMTEIGDFSRFHTKKALAAFAGLDSPPNVLVK